MLLLDILHWLSPLMARELAFRRRRGWELWRGSWKSCWTPSGGKDFCPYLLVREGKPGRTLLFCPSSSTGPRPREPAGRRSFPQLLDGFYEGPGSRWSRGAPARAGSGQVGDQRPGPDGAQAGQPGKGAGGDQKRQGAPAGAGGSPYLQSPRDAKGDEHLPGCRLL